MHSAKCHCNSSITETRRDDIDGMYRRRLIDNKVIDDRIRRTCMDGGKISGMCLSWGYIRAPKMPQLVTAVNHCKMIDVIALKRSARLYGTVSAGLGLIEGPNFQTVRRAVSEGVGTMLRVHASGSHQIGDGGGSW
jgi:hypothetical protein